MSLYDKYHSEYNKNYMYNLIKNVCNSELNINIEDRKDYEEYYDEQYPIIFEETKSEEITDINKELLDKMVSIIMNDNKRDKQTKKKYIYSSYDRIDLINQSCYNFKIDHKCDDIKISTNFDFKPQNYQNIAKSLSIKIYVARANLEKGGMIPEQSKSKALESNKSIVFKEFDTGHNIMSESTDEYFEFVSEFLNYR